MHIIWTWQFQLDDILTTLTIVGLIGGASYRLLILPVLTQNEERMNRLNETLVELKEEIKLSREQRTKEYAEHIKLVTRVDGIENRVDELRGDLHEYNNKIRQFS